MKEVLGVLMCALEYDKPVIKFQAVINAIRRLQGVKSRGHCQSLVPSTMIPTMSELNLHRILHAGYLLESAKARIIFDPLFENPFSVNCFAFPEVRFDLAMIQKLELDAIFISHYHEDHCSFESLQHLDRKIPLFMFCQHPEMFELLARLKFENIHSLELGQSIQIGDFEITPHQALDSDVDCLFEIRQGNIQILNVVDSWIGEKTLSILQKKEWDIILWPFQTMRELEVLSPGPGLMQDPVIPEEWIEQLKLLNPKVLVPSSCQFQMEPGSWYNSFFFPITYQFFSENVQAILPKTEVRKLNPGTGVQILKSKSEIILKELNCLKWITAVGNQDRDYFFNPTSLIPSTAQIARTLPPLREDQEKDLHAFLEVEIIPRFRELDPDLYSYFFRSRTWLLEVYFTDGKVIQKSFAIKNSDLVPVFESPLNHDWKTEVLATKLWGALHQGESLNSLYPRIFPRECLSELSDLLQDPLLRLLYEGRFASYQKSQLQRIKDDFN